MTTHENLPARMEAEPYELTVTPRRFQAMAATRQAIVEFIQTQLRRDVDYGQIPGCGKKDVLFQPGVQKICALMHVYPDDDVIISDLGGGHREYTVKTRLKHTRPDGIEITVATGQGSCSTRESKYAYRNDKRHCPECGSDGLKKTRQNKFWCPEDQGGCGLNFPLNDQRITSQQIGKVENPDIADTYNTVLKMAIKRANMAATLNLAGGWSDRFEQADNNEPPPQKQSRPAPQKAQPQQQPPRITVEAVRKAYADADQAFKDAFDANLEQFKREGMSSDDAAINAYDKTLST